MLISPSFSEFLPPVAQNNFTHFCSISQSWTKLYPSVELFLPLHVGRAHCVNWIQSGDFAVPYLIHTLLLFDCVLAVHCLFIQETMWELVIIHLIYSFSGWHKKQNE